MSRGWGETYWPPWPCPPHQRQESISAPERLLHRWSLSALSTSLPSVWNFGTSLKVRNFWEVRPLGHPLVVEALWGLGVRVKMEATESFATPEQRGWAWHAGSKDPESPYCPLYPLLTGRTELEGTGHIGKFHPFIQLQCEEHLAWSSWGWCQPQRVSLLTPSPWSVWSFPQGLTYSTSFWVSSIPEAKRGWLSPSSSPPTGPCLLLHGSRWGFHLSGVLGFVQFFTVLWCFSEERTMSCSLGKSKHEHLLPSPLLKGRSRAERGSHLKPSLDWWPHRGPELSLLAQCHIESRRNVPILPASVKMKPMLLRSNLELCWHHWLYPAEATGNM